MKRRAHSIWRSHCKSDGGVWGGVAVYDDDFVYMILSLASIYNQSNGAFTLANLDTTHRKSS